MINFIHLMLFLLATYLLSSKLALGNLAIYCNSAQALRVDAQQGAALFTGTSVIKDGKISSIYGKIIGYQAYSPYSNYPGAASYPSYPSYPGNSTNPGKSTAKGNVTFNANFDVTGKILKFDANLDGLMVYLKSPDDLIKKNDSSRIERAMINDMIIRNMSVYNFALNCCKDSSKPECAKYIRKN